jgi:hypothetical protein
LLLTAALAYTLTCFALVLYPPFQIPCALVTAGLCLGYLIESFHPLGKKVWLQKLGYAAIALAITALASLTFLVTRSDAVHTVQNTAYPGKRVVASGGYSLTHLFSGNLDAQLKTPSLVDKYQMPKLGVTNQSEASSFFFVWPFLILPSIVIIVRLYMKEKRVDWPLTIVTGLFFVALLWLFVPHLGILGKVLLLNIVPHNRFIIGLGLLGIIQIPLIIRSLEKQRSPFTLLHAALYSIAVLCIELVLDFHVKAAFPGFIGQYRAIAFALPAAAIIFALLRRMNNLAALGLLAFTAFMTIGVNPLYRGTAILTSNKVIAAISKVSSSDPTAKWVIEDGNLENFAIMGGAPSLSGIYTYPQLQLWQPLDKSGNSEALYNRYAHVSINLDRDGSKQITDGFIMPTFDHFGVKAEPCGNFLRSANVHYALTEAPLSKEDSCAKRIEVVTYPTTPFYLYRVH